MASLFNRKVIEKHRSKLAEAPPEHLAVLAPWAKSIENGSIFKQNETSLHGDFKARILEDVLGYVRFGLGEAWTCSAEKQMGRGPVDLAIGRFVGDVAASSVIAPVELKAAVSDLDAIMPGRRITPVQQAWHYAIAVKGCRWVIVSNYVELRLYAFGEGSQNFETFELRRLVEPEEYARFMLLLSAETLLGGVSERLLRESHEADKEITESLYRDYRDLRGDLLAAVDDAAPTMGAEERIGVAQTILDRVLFVAFAEDTGLLPARTLSRAFEHSDPYNPRPVWDNFKGLFRRIDRGDGGGVALAERILKYNGGLFKFDPLIDDLTLPDAVCEGFKRIGEYDFESEVGVTILGHIFEQSIADMERLIAKARGEAPEEPRGAGATGRRKRDGVVYTPDYIARFIVEQTIGAHLREMLADCAAPRMQKGCSVEDYENVRWRNRGAERAAWEDYQQRLTRLRVVDPACGSGVFLVMAFDYLREEYRRVNAKVAELRNRPGETRLFDPDSEILSRNLFGVDVNAESVEITKLSLWIKTARRGKVLDSLDQNIKVGDSLIEDSSFAYRRHGFTWRDAFPQVFAEGGFDIVLGNPPYVRMELLKALKPYLQTRYEVVADRADLYAYFYERGLRVLKPGGRLGYISSATFFKTGSGAPLRNFLRREAVIETLVDFGDLQVFAGVTTYPAILTMQRAAAPRDHAIRFRRLEEIPKGEFSAAFLAGADGFPQAELTDGSWEFEGGDLLRLRRKIRDGRPMLKEVYGLACRGIVTGLNAAFVVDTPTRDRLIRQDPKSAELLRPWLEGKDLKRWRAEPRGLWVIYIPKNRVDIRDYPAIEAHLLAFRQRLEARATKQEWFELQQAQEAYGPAFEATKIVYGEFAEQNIFSLDTEEYFLNNKCYFIPSDDERLVALLNSNVFRFFINGVSVAMRGGFTQLHSQYVELTPIPDLSGASELASAAVRASRAAKERLGTDVAFARRIPDLCPEGRDPHLDGKLRAWWRLPDFAAFRRAVKARWRIDLPPRVADQWHSFFDQQKAEVTRLTAEIEAAEADIDRRVYALFDLTPEEIALLEATIR